MNTFIYALKDPRTGLVRYVGKANDPGTRLKWHLHGAKSGGTYKNCWILSLRAGRLLPVLEVLDEVPAGRWQFFERAYIKVYRESGARLVNGTDGGEGGRVSLEAIEKIRAAARRRKCSPETRAKLSAARRGEGNNFFGRHHSAETRENISVARRGEKHPFFGKKHTPETREKQRAASLGKKHSEEARAKMRGPHSAEHRAKIAAANRGKKHSEEARAKMRGPRGTYAKRSSR